jgi:hypothetical protein
MKKTLFIMTVLAVFLTACSPGQTPEEAQAQINTAVAAALATQQQLIDQAVASTLTAVAQNVSSTPVGPANTPLSFPTLTPVIPTITPFVINTLSGGGGGGSGSGSGSSGAGAPQYDCALVSQKPRDGAAIYKPGDEFDVEWTLKNTGKKTIAAGYSFQYISGTNMSPTGMLVTETAIAPGESFTFRIEVIAPDVQGVDKQQFTMQWAFIVEGDKICKPYISIFVQK